MDSCDWSCNDYMSITVNMVVYDRIWLTNWCTKEMGRNKKSSFDSAPIGIAISFRAMILVIRRAVGSPGTARVRTNTGHRRRLSLRRRRVQWNGASKFRRLRSAYPPSGAGVPTGSRGGDGRRRRRTRRRRGSHRHWRRGTRRSSSVFHRGAQFQGFVRLQ